MRYGRTASGKRWHMVGDDGRLLCMGSLPKVVQDEVAPDDERCLNCDSALRMKGTSKRRELAALPKVRTRRDDYEPRNRFKE